VWSREESERREREREGGEKERGRRERAQGEGRRKIFEFPVQRVCSVKLVA